MANKQPIVIGSKTLIDFPKFGIKRIPAKVDTGADSSSIWASNISEKHGRLSFTLFGSFSPFYTGEVISTKDYHIRSIRNSFGKSELRYIVKLNVFIEGRTVNVSFSLADRSTNHFPVLIGKRTLQGRFLVDVSRIGLKEKLQVLVLKSNDLNKTGAAASFFKDVQKKNKSIHFSFATFKDLRFVMTNDNTQIKIGKSGKKITDFDVVYFRVVLTNKDIASATAQFLRQRNIQFLDRAAIHYNQSLNKLHQQIILQNAGISMPDSFYIAKEELPKHYKELEKTLGKPFVLKDIRGKKGKNIMLINSKKSFVEAMNMAKSKELELIAQKFIPHDGHYRILVMGKQVRMVTHRVHKMADSRLKNPNEEASTKLVEQHVLPGNVREMAIKAADTLMIDVAGVDILQDKESGLWYCLEVNEAPQLVTGSYLEEKKEVFTDYLEKKLEKIA